MITKAQTDWLATNSVFYNEKTGKISHRISDVIDFEHFDWDWEGLENFLNFGYCVFGHTPVKYVKFLPADSTITKDEQGKLVISRLTSKDEERLAALSNPSTPNEVLELIRSKIESYQQQHPEEIALPLSAGYDSRLMLHFLPDKSKVHAFTYPVGSKQQENWEVVFAKYIAQKTNIKWELVPLDSFTLLIDEWYDIFGVSTHLHGMYQMEFYQKIRNRYPTLKHVLSGMVGDIWAGNIMSNAIDSPSQIAKLGYTHGWNADAYFLCNKPAENTVNLNYFENNRRLIGHKLFSVIETVRTKVMLLKYLLQVPDSKGFHMYAPFIEEDVVLAMLRLPEKERQKRKWQKEFFDRVKLDTSNLEIKRSYLNDIDHYVVLKYPLKPLSEKILKEIISENYVRKINNNLLNNWRSKLNYYLFRRLGTTKGFRRFLKDKFTEHYAPYTILYPLQKLIEARNAYFKK